MTIPPGTYWPDLRPNHGGHQYPINKLDDLLVIANQLTMDQLHPIPQPITPTPTFQTAEAAFQSLKWWSYDWMRALFENATTGS